MEEVHTAHINTLYDSVKQILLSARHRAYSAVNVAMVQSYWEIGKLIAEEELRGKQRADYGKYVMKELANRLTCDFGKGFDERELRRICQFY